jgi:hypothetical protein
VLRQIALGSDVYPQASYAAINIRVAFKLVAQVRVGVSSGMAEVVAVMPIEAVAVVAMKARTSVKVVAVVNMVEWHLDV